MSTKTAQNKTKQHLTISRAGESVQMQRSLNSDIKLLRMQSMTVPLESSLSIKLNIHLSTVQLQAFIQEKRNIALQKLYMLKVILSVNEWINKLSYIRKIESTKQ